VVNGVAAGAGMALALACDLRIASTKASFVTAFSKLAMSGDFGGSYFLSKLVGPAKAKELYFLSDRIVAKEAEQLGMINRCVEPEVLAAEVSAVAERLVTIPLLTYKAMKSNLNAALTMDLRTVIKQEAEWMIKTAFSEDTRMAADTFFEK
jgi:2-(1,2-epoxy-1,2-dihydrophenyl)acetyl-CoA isomerase